MKYNIDIIERNMLALFSKYSNYLDKLLHLDFDAGSFRVKLMITSDGLTMIYFTKNNNNETYLCSLRNLINELINVNKFEEFNTMVKIEFTRRNVS